MSIGQRQAHHLKYRYEYKRYLLKSKSKLKTKQIKTVPQNLRLDHLEFDNV